MDTGTTDRFTTSLDSFTSVSSVLEMKEGAWEKLKKSSDSFCLMDGDEDLIKCSSKTLRTTVVPDTSAGPESVPTVGETPGDTVRW